MHRRRFTGVAAANFISVPFALLHRHGRSIQRHHNERRAKVNISMRWFKRFQYIARMMVCALVACGITACSSMQSVSSLEAQRLVSEARIVLLNFLRDPDQTWIQQNLNRARGV